jgi:predicted membrane chloride channel (bestrophin family)
MCDVACLLAHRLQELGWLSVPISMVVSFLLFGIEEIGVQIEEPFGILALEVRQHWNCLSAVIGSFRGQK